MKLEQYRTLWGVIDVADGEPAKSPHHTFEEVHSAICVHDSSRRVASHRIASHCTALQRVGGQVMPVLKGLGYDGIELPFKLLLHIGPDKVHPVAFFLSVACTRECKQVRTTLNELHMKINIMVFSDNVVVPGAGILWGGPYTQPDGTLYTVPCYHFFSRC